MVSLPRLLGWNCHLLGNYCCGNILLYKTSVCLHSKLADQLKLRSEMSRRENLLHNLDGILLNGWQYLPGSLEGKIRQAVMIITPHFVLKMLKGTLYKKTKIDEIFFPRMCQNRRVQFSNERTVVNYAKNYLTGEQKI